MNDLISRQAAIDAVADLYWMDERLLNFKKEIDATFDKIKALPSAQPEWKKGKWLPENRTMDAFWVCSSCGFPSEAHAANILYHFCPNCGADMRGEQDDSF